MLYIYSYIGGYKVLFISNSAIDISEFMNEYPKDSIEMQLLNKMSTSSEKYQYSNLNQLKFELNLRKEIVNSAIDLNNSDLNFSVFEDSRCNPEYWHRTSNGGFLLNNGAKPNEAIRDIFSNGSKYATECATAMMIVYYKGLLNVYGDDLFNRLFPEIYLMGWDVREPLLKEVAVLEHVTDILLGDRGYFNNPDFNPRTPQWEGENVIVLPNSLYYGHGIGITTANTIIQELNSARKENATHSAYLMHSLGRPNFNKLFSHYQSTPSRMAPLVWKPFPPPIS